MHMSVRLPNGRTQNLIEITDWDPSWQHAYYFQKPIPLPAGSVVNVVAHFDNSAHARNPNKPPKLVKYGPNADDEMCVGYIAVVKKGQDLTVPGSRDDLFEIFYEAARAAHPQANDQEGPLRFGPGFTAGWPGRGRIRYGGTDRRVAESESLTGGFDMLDSMAFLGLALLLGGAAEPPPVTAGEFQGWFEDGLPGRLRIPGPVAGEQALPLRVRGRLPIGRTPGYFTQNAKELRAIGVPRRSIHFLYPDSHKTVEENRETVRDEILRIAGDRPERLVIIAHSRGACDALTFALHEPEFVRVRVEALFLIQAAFGGTGLADYVLGEGKPMDDQMARGHRFLARGIGGFVRYLLKHGKQGGLTGLTREASRAYWTLALEEHEDASRSPGRKSSMSRPMPSPRDLGLFMRAMASYLGAYYGPNDGVVAVEDQTIPGPWDEPGGPGGRPCRPHPPVPVGAMRAAVLAGR